MEIRKNWGAYFHFFLVHRIGKLFHIEQFMYSFRHNLLPIHLCVNGELRK